MPGIHVHTPGKCDWINREAEPILTVPGSYWLCHRNYIYKFTFKYHKSSRHNKEFNNGKELMKVIRRIIKSQPRQGQQFGTRHLLVTYNPSSWTRQDKMFAMMKFCERKNATAFPRAFVLTVKLLTTSQTADNGNQYDVKLSKEVQWTETKRQRRSNVDIQFNGGPTLRPSIIPDEASNDSSMKRTLFNSIESMTSAHTSVSIKSTTTTQDPPQKTTCSFFADIDDLPLLERYILEQRDPSENPDSSNYENLNDIQETVDMPYQYLIEREIQQSHRNISAASSKKMSEKSLKDTASRNKSQIVDNSSLARTANITDLVMEGLMFTIRQDEDTITVMEQKTKLEPDEVLENSEKIETSEGAECLVNSSLLKLENLITKIEMSAKNAQSSSRHQLDQNSIFPMNSSEEIKINNNKVTENGIAINGSVKTMTISNNLKDNQCDKSKPDDVIKPITVEQPSINEKTNTSNSSRVPLVKINLSNVQNVLNHTNYRSDTVSQTINFTEEPMALDEPNNNELQSIEVNEKEQNNNNNIDDISDSPEEEEGIIPEALHKDLNDFNYEKPENSCLSNSTPSSNLQNENIQVDNKSNIPRIISNEIVQYDLSALRSSWLRPKASTPVKLELSQSTEIADIQETKEPVERKLDLSNGNKINKSSRESRPTSGRRTAKRRQKNKNEEVTIEMWKFWQDMTHGVRVVLDRLDLSSLSDDTVKRSCPPKCII